MYDKIKECHEIKTLVELVLGSQCYTDKIKFWNIFFMELNNIRKLKDYFTSGQCSGILRMIFKSLTGEIFELESDMESYKDVYCDIKFQSDIFPSIFEIVQLMLVPMNIQRYKYEKIKDLATKSYVIKGEEIRVLEETETASTEDSERAFYDPLIEKFLKIQRRQMLANKKSLKLKQKCGSVEKPKRNRGKRVLNSATVFNEKRE